MPDFSDILANLDGAFVGAVRVSERKITDVDETIPDGYPKVGVVFLAGFERLYDGVDDVYAFLGMAILHRSADNGF